MINPPQIGVPGSAAPADAAQVGGTDGTNLRAFSVDTSGRMNVNVVGNAPAQSMASSKAVAGTLFGAGTGAVTMTGSAVAVAALVNPSGSGKSLYVTWMSVGCGVSAQYSRTRNATVTGGTAMTTVNRGGASTPTPVGKLYQAPTLSGGTAERTGFTGGVGMDNIAVNGEIVLPPGSSLCWSMFNVTSILGLLTGAATGSVEVNWWEA